MENAEKVSDFPPEKKYLEKLFWTVRIDWMKHVVNNTKVVGSIPI